MTDTSRVPRLNLNELTLSPVLRHRGTYNGRALLLSCTPVHPTIGIDIPVRLRVHMRLEPHVHIQSGGRNLVQHADRLIPEKAIGCPPHVGHWHALHFVLRYLQRCLLLDGEPVQFAPTRVAYVVSHKRGFVFSESPLPRWVRAGVDETFWCLTCKAEGSTTYFAVKM